MAILLPNGKQHYTTPTGTPLMGGELRTFDAGTNNPRPTFADADELVANTNPVILDARGEAVIFWHGSYKVELLDAHDVIIWTVDGIQGFDLNDVIDELADTTDITKGDAMIGVKQPLPGSVGRTQHDKNTELMTSDDFPTWGSRNLFVGGGKDIAATIAGIENIAIGYNILTLADDSYANIGIGTDVLSSTVSGHYNIAIGAWAMRFGAAASENVAIGVFSSANITTGVANTGVGTDTHRYHESGTGNVAVGVQAAYNNITGSDNVAIGARALRGAVNPPDIGPGTGLSFSFCVAVGADALFTTGVAAAGFYNTAVGNKAGSAPGGSFNTFVGADSGYKITSGARNTMIGYQAGFNAAQKVDATSTIAIGDGATTTGDFAIAIGTDVVAPANTTRIGSSQTVTTIIEGHVVSHSDETQDIGTNANYWRNLYAVRLAIKPTTVGSLPPPAGLTGLRQFVIDATAVAFSSVVVGGGANRVPVYCDGTNWRIG